MEDSTTNYSTIIISVLMAVVIIATVMIPIITATTQTTTTTGIDNEGAGWIKLGYNEGADYSFNVGYETITVDEVETEIFKVGEQTGDYENMICYADPQRTLFISGDSWYLLTAGETPTVHKFTDTASVSNASGTLTINDGSTAIYSGASPTWAYVPDTNGVYGFFKEGNLNLEEDKPKVAVGSYAGVFAYNDTVVAPDNLGTLGLVKSGDYADGVVTWIVPNPESTDENTEETPLNANYGSDSIGLDGGNNIILRSADPSTGTQVGDLYYTFSGSNATIIGYSSTADWLSITSIPDTVTYNGVTYTITSIGNNAFLGCTNLSLTSLPSGVTSIGSNAFQNCSHLALTSLPSGVTSILARTFQNCTNLSLTSLPSGVTSIGSNAFLGCTNLSLTSLPSGVTSIGSNAFQNCSHLALTSLPSGVTYIQDSTFDGCTNLSLTSLDGVTSIGNFAFQNCSHLALTSLPDNVSRYGLSAFRGCTNLALTSLPDNLTSIPNGSFIDCTNLALTSLDGVTSIGAYAFENCRSMSITYLPDTVTSIGNNAFGNCRDALSSLIVFSSPTIGSNAFIQTNIKEVLNFGDTEITPTSYGLTADSVQDYVSALGYVAPVSIHNTIIVEDTSLSATLLKLLPVFMVLAVVIFIGYAMYRPDSEFIQSLKNKL